MMNHKLSIRLLERQCALSTMHQKLLKDFHGISLKPKMAPSVQSSSAIKNMFVAKGKFVGLHVSTLLSTLWDCHGDTKYKFNSDVLNINDTYIICFGHGSKDKIAYFKEIKELKILFDSGPIQNNYYTHTEMYSRQHFFVFEYIGGNEV